MPKLSYNPVDKRPAPAGMAMIARISGMTVMVAVLIGFIMILTDIGNDPPKSWDWRYADVTTNFSPILTTKELRAKLRAGLQRSLGDAFPISDRDATTGVNRPNEEDRVPFEDPPDNSAPPSREEMGGIDGRIERRQRDAYELELIKALKKGPWLDLDDETQDILGFVPFEDRDRTRAMDVHRARKGRLSPDHERLALKLLHKLPAADSPGYKDWNARLEPPGAYYFGTGQPALDGYRARLFNLKGRLFDLYQIKLETPVILESGAKIDAYYEGVVCFLRDGTARYEFPVQQETVLFQCLTLPDDLKPYVDTDATLSHDDKLAGDEVGVSLSGLYLRRWVFSREVSPFSSASKRIYSQASTPLLLSADVAKVASPEFELTDQLLQQVKDGLRDNPATSVTSEAAYFALLAKARRDDDQVEILETISYFDLSGQERGPKYRGQGIAIEGMIGDDYQPTVLQPNISGLRRVYRALVVADMFDLQSPKRYIVDMIEIPSGLEPRAIVGFKARYYCNIYTFEEGETPIRPLLVVRKIGRLNNYDASSDWIYIMVGVGGLLLLVGVLAFFVMSDRRERARFERETMARTRERLEKSGALRLKPLPKSKGSTPDQPEKPPKDKPGKDA